MTSPTHRPECSAALSVAFELSATEWLLTMSPGRGTRPQRTRVRAGDGEAIARAVTTAKARFGMPATAPVWSCYEAGRDGFWPHRLLTTLGFQNVVVDSSSIEVPRRLRRAKTDRLDGDKLLRQLQRYGEGERAVWHVVPVPSREAEDARHASRALTTLLAERTRYRNRIHSLLALHGVPRRRIDERFGERLATIPDWSGALLPPGVQARLQSLWRVLETVEAEVQQARREERQRVRAMAPASAAQRLARLGGVGARSATVLAHELFGRRLRNRREVGALTGLVSAPYASGTLQRDQGLTRGGLPAVRRIAVELAWGWLRYQPTSALSRWYHARFGQGGGAARRIGIVALARRIVIALWRYVDQGIVPAGAQLKA